MKHRGKILRDTNAGPGLLSIDGVQHPFTLEAHWKSDTPPRVGMVVEVEIDSTGALLTVAPVAETQLAKEQAELAMQAAKAKGGELAAGLTARFGVPTLAAMAALLVGWFFLNTIAIQISSSYRVGLSFWKILGVLNSPATLMASFSDSGAGAGGGGYALLCIVALIAPLAPQVWKDKRAYLGGLLPLAFMLLVAVMIYLGINDSMKQAHGMASAFGGNAESMRMAENVSRQMMQEALRAISVGIGGYLSLIASLYLAGRGVIQFLAAKA